MKQRKPGAASQNARDPLRHGRGQPPGPDGRGRTRHQPAARPEPRGSRYWIYGLHAAAAALANPRRRLTRAMATAEAEGVLAEALQAARARLGERFVIARAERADFLARLGTEAVHQGIAVEAEPLAQPDLSQLAAACGTEATLLLLDQVTDPHNVGAILRSAAAFGSAGVAMTEHHAPPETGSLAKAASGGLEQIPLLRVANLSQAMELLKRERFWCFGLGADGSQDISEVDLGGRVAFVLGAEGTGLRRLTRERCDLVLRLPTRESLVQLNVSNAAAISLYERARRRRHGTGREPERG